MKILTTGTAGFIGNALAVRLLERGHQVVGVETIRITQLGQFGLPLKRAEITLNVPHREVDQQLSPGQKANESLRRID